MAMDKNTMIVSIVAGILGLLSVLLGFAAEATKIQLSDIIYTTYYGCTHPKSPAFGMAIAAALLLLIAQIMLNVLGCCGCCKTSNDISANVMVSQVGSKRTSAIIMICASWATFLVSFILFLSGALINTPGGQINYYCTTVKPGIFATASFFSLLTVGLGIGAHFLLQNTYIGSTNSVVNPGIAMGTPQQYPQQGVNGPTQFQQQGFGQTVQKPGIQTQQQNYYPPPGRTPSGYGYNTGTNM
ncbi:hypothetical protein LUZ60_014182 [Juncus effusus]|nr:hypothetical protein LUZ60_014182 [Juncus effusus]